MPATRIEVESPPVDRAALAEWLAAYGRVPIAFEVSATARVKDYDAIAGQAPHCWAQRFDVARWWFVGAYTEDKRVGGAAIVPDAADVAMPVGERAAVAVLWDLRVHPGFRRQGIGRALVRAAEGVARRAGRAWLAVETQDVNVPACRLYAACGFELGDVDRHAYDNLPDETRLVWYKRL
jgi:GNAT superfamily N-acetyltransferase